MTRIVYGGLDVRKESIEAYLCCPETGEVVTERLRHDKPVVLRAVRRWSKLGMLKLCYEASARALGCSAGWPSWGWSAWWSRRR